LILNPADFLGIAIATLGGAAVGLEREWSGHAIGPGARFAGIRTFTLLGLQAGITGWLWSNGSHALATVLIAGGAALVVAAYAAASRIDVEGTTEVAALVVLATGVVAGIGELKLASAAIALTTLLLIEKSRLHAMATRLDDTTLRAGFRFAVMAVVILPLLPDGPFGPLGGVRPRQLWTLVLFFCALSFAGYIARRAAGDQLGYPLAGLLGGIISSTSVTFSFARISRSDAGSGTALAVGAIGASAVMCVRVLIATMVLNPAAAAELAIYVAAPFAVGALIAWWGITKHRERTSTGQAPSNPLQFVSAAEMAALFQAVLFAVRWAQGAWGQIGVLVSAAVFGLTDIDALVISMAKDAAGRLSPANIAQAIAIGVLTNTLLKLAIGIVIGEKHFRRVLARGLGGMALASAASIAGLR